MRASGLWRLAWIGACAALAGCLCETQDTSYATAADAIERGALRKGWIPGWLPADATDIREVHNIDTNASELSFAITGLASVQLPPECKPVEHRFAKPATFRRAWWPSDRELGESFRLYECPPDATEHTFVAVHTLDNRVLHWRTYGR